MHDASLTQESSLEDHSSHSVFLTKLKESFAKVGYLERVLEALDRIVLEDEILTERCLEIASLALRKMGKKYFRSRSIDLIEWLIGSLVKKENYLCSQEPYVVEIRKHIVQYPFQKREACSVLIFYNTLVKRRLMLASLENLLSGFSLVHESFIVHKGFEDEMYAIYFEVQSLSESFSKVDEKFLKESLPKRIFEDLEEKDFVVPSNRELLMKSAHWVLKDLHPGDVPEVLIDFSKQSKTAQHFSLLICSIGAKKSELASEKIKRGEFQVEGLVQTKEGHSIKESLLVSLEVQSVLSLSPVEGRKKCVEIVKSLIGPFRDFNGGLLEKAEENLSDLSTAIGESSSQLKAFFYSISPQEMQIMLSIPLLRLAYTALSRAKFQLKENMLEFLEDGLALSICLHSTQETLLKNFQVYMRNRYPEAFFSKLSGKVGEISCCTVTLSTALEMTEIKRKAQEYLKDWLNQKEQKQTLRIPMGTTFTSFDPRIGTDAETSYLHRLLFTGLMKMGSQGVPEYALAKDVQVLDQGKHYRFHLRESYWSNGDPVTPEDFIYAWKTSVRHDFFSPLCHFFYPIKNAKKIKEGILPPETLGVASTSSHVLDIYLEYPCSYFLSLCTHPVFSPIHQKLDQKRPSWPHWSDEKFICNGGFCLSSASDTLVKIKKNPRYWNAQDVALEKIAFISMTEIETIEQFQKGEVDVLVSPLSKVDTESLKFKPTLHKCFEYVENKYLCFNCQSPLFKHEKVRSGISLAIDRKALASAYSVSSIPHASPFSQYFTSLYLSEIKDLGKARELFAEGLKESNLSIKDVYDLELNVTPQNRKLAALLISIINQNLSLNWHVKVQNPSKVLSLIYQGKCELSIFGWIDSIMDPRYYLEIFSSNVPMNHSNWSHPKFQSLIQEMRTCSESVESETLLLQAEKMLMKFTPMAPLFFTPRYSYAQSHLSVSKTEKRLDLLKLCKL